MTIPKLKNFTLRTDYSLKVLVLVLGLVVTLSQTSYVLADDSKDGSSCVSNIEAEFSTSLLSVLAISDKGLSNVVLHFVDGVEQKFEINSGTDLYSQELSGTGANAGKLLQGIWIKSGCEKSGDGSGYGLYIAAPVCDFTTTISISPLQRTQRESTNANFVISLDDSAVPEECIAGILITTVPLTAGISDYESLSINAALDNSNPSITINIPILSDDITEMIERFEVNAVPAPGSAVTNSVQGIVIILDGTPEPP